MQADWIPARFFGGGLPATGEPAEVAIAGDELRVRSAAGIIDVPIAAMRVREIGSAIAGIEFGWDTPAGARIVHVFDAADVRTLLANPTLAASPQVQALRTRQWRHAAGRAVGWTAIALLVSLPLLLLLVFVWQSDRIAGAIAERIPVEKEVELGKQAFESMRGSLKLQTSGPAYHAVQLIGARLAQGSRYSYRFHVADAAAINAFALPGGIIIVNTGLIGATRRAEQLAGVLAHEVQHVERRHSLQSLVKDLGLRGVWLLVTGDITGGWIGRATLELTALKFSRDAEYEADMRGFDLLVRENIDPAGIADFFEVLAQQNDALPAFLSTHPGSGERQQTLRGRYAELGVRAFVPLDLGPWPPH
jgi:beta-barrel assembly-enhancing protease